MKFVKKKESTLSGHTEVSFTQVAGEGEKPQMPPFSVIAGQSGIRFYGTFSGEISSREELDEFAQIVAAAWISHTELRKAIQEKIMGHS